MMSLTIDLELLEAAINDFDGDLEGTAGRKLKEAFVPFLIEVEHEHFRSGDRFALMRALYFCADIQVPMPDWVAEEYSIAYRSISKYRVKSWDEVLPRPLAKGEHLESKRQDTILRYPVLLQVESLRVSEDLRLDEYIFEKAGSVFGLGKTKTSELYYSVPEKYRSSLHQYMLDRGLSRKDFRKDSDFRGNT